MLRSELIRELMDAAPADQDPEVLSQSHGCCSHGHEIIEVTPINKSFAGLLQEDEKDKIVIRV